jgi:hypothetical protein
MSTLNQNGRKKYKKNTKTENTMKGPMHNVNIVLLSSYILFPLYYDDAIIYI